MNNFTAQDLVSRTSEITSEYLGKYQFINTQICNAINLARQAYVNNYPSAENAYFNAQIDSLKAGGRMNDLFLGEDHHANLTKIPKGVSAEGIELRFRQWIKHAVLLDTSLVKVTNIESSGKNFKLTCYLGNAHLNGTEARLTFTPDNESGAYKMDLAKCFVVNLNQNKEYYASYEVEKFQFTMPDHEQKINVEDMSRLSNLITTLNKPYDKKSPHQFTVDNALKENAYFNNNFTVERQVILEALIELYANGGRVAEDDCMTVTALLDNTHSSSYLALHSHLYERLPECHQQLINTFAEMNDQLKPDFFSLGKTIAILCRKRFKEIDYQVSPIEALTFLNDAEDKLANVEGINNSLLGVELRRYMIERQELKDSLALAEALDSCIGDIDIAQITEKSKSNDQAVQFGNAL